MGSHFKLVSSEVVDLTPELAAAFNSMPASMTERDLKPKRLKYLSDAILGGTALTFSWARAKIAGTGDTYRVNGHHSSNVLAGLNGAFPAGLRAHIDDYEVSDKASLALLFRQFDNRLSARTVDDISGAYQGLQEELVSVPKNAGRVAIDGAAWYMAKVIGHDVPKGDDRFDLFNDPKLHPFIQMVGRVYSVKTPEFTNPVVGTMFGTWEREPAVAETFWSEVAKQGSGEVNDPATALDAYLVEARNRKNDRPKDMEVHRACALAWNAHRHGKTLDKIGRYDPKKGAPDLD